MIRQMASLPSVFDVLKPAVGPSSSHTLGPMRAGQVFRRRLESYTGPQPGGRIQVTLCGSLAHTGKGHLTDRAVVAGLAGFGPDTLQDRTLHEIYQDVCEVGMIATASNWFVFHPQEDIVFDRETESLPHPNTMRFALLDLHDKVQLSTVFLSLGGGSLAEGELSRIDEAEGDKPQVSAREIIECCRTHRILLPEFVIDVEREIHGRSPDAVLEEAGRIWERMRGAIADGLRNTGVLPGPLKLDRRAAAMYARLREAGPATRMVSEETSRAAIYAIAVAEENADGGRVVTAPTCGAAGVVPACLRATQEALGLPDGSIHEALLVAGLIGALAMAKASIAGALVGCQGEIGVASAMAAAAVCHLLGGSVEDQIDRAAETALEHYLGLTCDPVAGLVQVPCIERNAAGAVSALNAASLALMSGGRDRVGFDATLEAMRQTGMDMPSRYKETSLGGLAAISDLDSDGIPDDWRGLDE